GLGSLEMLDEDLDGFLHGQRRKGAAQYPQLAHDIFLEQQLFLPGTGHLDVHRREDPLVEQISVQVELHVTGTFELFEDEVVHLVTGIDERRGQNCQTATKLDVSRRAEEALRLVQRVRVHTTGQSLSAGGNGDVVRARQPGEA